MKIIINILALLLLAGCQNQKSKKMQEEKNFSWSASVTSIKDYPIEVHTGYLATKKEFITAFRNNGIEKKGWQVEGTEGGAGGNQIPTLLSLTWLSYAEKKFWLLDEVSLPADKIQALFQEGFYNTDRVSTQPVHETYEHIVVAVAPGGVAVVFLTGNYHRVELARYQAKETAVEVDDFMPRPGLYKNTKEFLDDYYNDKEFIKPSLKEKIKKDGIPYGLWDTYRKRYNWRFDVQFYKEEDKLTDPLAIEYINGESVIFKLGDEEKFKNHALPKEATFYYKDHWNEATFNEAEIVAAFKKVTQGNPEAEVIIVAKVEFMYKGVILTVKCGDNEVLLKKVVVENGGYGR